MRRTWVQHRMAKAEWLAGIYRDVAQGARLEQRVSNGWVDSGPFGPGLHSDKNKWRVVWDEAAA